MAWTGGCSVDVNAFLTSITASVPGTSFAGEEKAGPREKKGASAFASCVPRAAPAHSSLSRCWVRREMGSPLFFS